MGAPSWLTDQGFAGKLEDVLRGTRPIGREDSALTMTQTLLRMLGTNIYPSIAKLSRIRNVRNMKREIDDAKNDMKRLMKDAMGQQRGKDDIQGIRKQYMAYIKDLTTRLREYMAESKVHPNLQ